MTKPQPVRVTFYGAAETVTGSKFLIHTDQHNVLIDCGLFQGKKELRLMNWSEPPFALDTLSAVVLTHAHIDHIGYLPLIVRRGYRGPIYCTPATRALVPMLLEDSARLQEEEAGYAAHAGYSRHAEPKPLYSAEDVQNTLPLLREIPRDQVSEILPGFRVTPKCAGHILGSATLTIDVGGKRLSFSGDIGRYNVPILPDPAPIEIGDLLLCESTYGNRDHASGEPERELGATIREAAGRKGPIIIPAFALGRAQTLLYYLSNLEQRGEIPVMPVYVDSPMAIDATNIYQSFHYDFDEEAKQRMLVSGNPLRTERTNFCRRSNESKALNSHRGSRIIIAGSGMVTGGRVLHHLYHWLPKPETTVVFVGYQGEETRGATIQSGAPSVKIFGQYVPIKAQVKTISGLSAHGDRGELIRWLKSSSGTPKTVRIIHGEIPASTAFAAQLRKEFSWNVEVAKFKESVEV